MPLSTLVLEDPSETTQNSLAQKWSKHPFLHLPVNILSLRRLAVSSTDCEGIVQLHAIVMVLSRQLGIWEKKIIRSENRSPRKMELYGSANTGLQNIYFCINCFSFFRFSRWCCSTSTSRSYGRTSFFSEFAVVLNSLKLESVPSCFKRSIRQATYLHTHKLIQDATTLCLQSKLSNNQLYIDLY